MARMRQRRRPYAQPRRGRLKEQINFAFAVSRGQPLTTGELVKYCYGVQRILFGNRSWYRENVRRAAAQIALPCGHGLGRGRPILWAPRSPVQDTPFANMMWKLYEGSFTPTQAKIEPKRS